MNWRWASKSVIGTSHIQSGERLQDAHSVSLLSNDGIFAVVSDGAGSAKFGAFGARLVCRFLTIRFREWVCENSELPTDKDLSNWIDELKCLISTIASRRGTVPRQFAATMAAVVVMAEETVTLQIGDSAIVGRRDDEWDVLCWPENGEYASSTYFVTDDPGPRLNINRHLSEYDAFALFSDGVGDLALSYLERVAHTPFFNPMIRPVDAASHGGHLVDLAVELANYLAGPLVCNRSDDDKTLILISRRR